MARMMRYINRRFT